MLRTDWRERLLAGPVRRVRARAFVAAGGARRALARLGGERAVIALYHRVLPAEQAHAGAVEPGMFVTPETFAAHLDWLANETTVIPLAELVERRRTGRPLPPRACAITFDDGWRDNLLHAAPVLEARGLPATLFVVTGRVGTAGAFWPDEVSRRLAAVGPARAAEVARALGAPPGRDAAETLIRYLKDLDPETRENALFELREQTSGEAGAVSPGGAPSHAGAARAGAAPAEPGDRPAAGGGAPPAPAASRELLDWSELAELARRGFAIESHGVTHALLPQLDDRALARELEGSLAALRERGFGAHALLAYPSGAHDPRVVRAARAAGYAAAVTTVPAWVGPGDDLHTLPRIGVHQDVARIPAELARRLLVPAA